MTPKADSDTVEMCPWCWGEGRLRDGAICYACDGEGLIAVAGDDRPPRCDFALPYWRWSSDAVSGEYVN